jgi:hypothetical protein
MQGGIPGLELTNWRPPARPTCQFVRSVTQRPNFGGEESIDKNKQTMTIPARTVATNMTRTSLRCYTGAIFLPNV